MSWMQWSQTRRYFAALRVKSSIAGKVLLAQIDISLPNKSKSRYSCCTNIGTGGVTLIYIALLRGINVGSHPIKMKLIREIFTELGFTNVRTYIQSGNVFFETEQTDRQALAQAIEQHLHKSLGYSADVFLRTIPEVEAVVALNPFKQLNVTTDMRLCIIFTADPIPKTLALPLRSDKKDIEIIYTTDYEAFVVWYLNNGRPPAVLSFKALGNKVTTRFFHTTAKILQAAKEGSKVAGHPSTARILQAAQADPESVKHPE
jgi:uncharacterized protein (DUF1697 family)